MIRELIKGTTIKEKSEIKSTEIVRVFPLGTFIKNNFEVFVQQVKKIDGGIEIIASAKVKARKVGFGKNFDIETERFRIYNPPIMIHNPNGIVVLKWVDDKGISRQIKLEENPVEAIKQVLVHTISVSGKLSDNIITGSVGNTTSTFFPDAGTGATTVDGFVRHLYGAGVGVDWTVLTADVGTAADATAATGATFRALADSVSNKWRDIKRAS